MDYIVRTGRRSASVAFVGGQVRKTRRKSSHGACAAGYYAYLEAGIAAFASDLERVCDLFETASQGKKSAHSRVLQVQLSD